MYICKLNGLLRINDLVTEPPEFYVAMLDKLEEDIVIAARLPKILVLEHDGDMLEIRVEGEMLYGSRIKLEAVVKQFARDYAVHSSRFDQEFNGKKDVLPMLSRADITDIDALLDDGDAAGDAVEKLGKDCTYLGEGEWLIGGRQRINRLNRGEIRELLIRGREAEIVKDPAVESGFIPRAPVASNLEPTCD